MESLNQSSWKGRKTKHVLKHVFLLLLLGAGAIFMIGPLVWMFLASFKQLNEVLQIPPTFLPEHPTFNNYVHIFTHECVPFPRYILNSLLVVSTVTVLVLFTSSLCGYIFAKFNFFAKNIIFLIILATMMIPFQVLIVPLYVIIYRLKLIDTYLALILPEVVTVYGIFLMKQFAEGIPNPLIDAARIDGCSEFRIFLQIILPQLKPPMIALGMFTFIWNWNSFIWPLVVINSLEMRTLPIGIQMLHTYKTGLPYHLLMAAASIAVIPVVIVFLVFQRKITKGITLSGLKM